jgi:hypothetical protein
MRSPNGGYPSSNFSIPAARTLELILAAQGAARRVELDRRSLRLLVRGGRVEDGELLLPVPRGDRHLRGGPAVAPADGHDLDANETLIIAEHRCLLLGCSSSQNIERLTRLSAALCRPSMAPRLAPT